MSTTNSKMLEWKPSDSLSGNYLQECSAALRVRGMFEQVAILERDCRVNNLNAEAKQIVIEEMSGRLGGWGE